VVLIPEENRKDLAEIPKNVKDKLDIRPVRWIDEILQAALLHQPSPIEEGEGKVTTRKTTKAKSKQKPLTAH
jgi:ATP-dependent Lon protease